MDDTTIRPVMIGIGDAEPRDTLLRYAASLALAEHRGLRFVHVIHPRAGAAGPSNVLIGPDEADQIGEQLVHSAAERTRELVGDQVPVHAVSCRGALVDVLLEEARDAHTILLERRRLSRLERVAVGSTTSGIVGRASIPVICIPDDWNGSSARDGRATVGVDETLSDSELVGHAFEVAERSSGSLTFLHTWYVPSIYDDTILGRTARTEWSERDKASITEALEPWRRAHPDVTVDVQVEHGRPGDVLVDASRRSDLIMLGRHHSAHRLPHLGALTRAVLREARCPVEVVPTLGRRETEPSISEQTGVSV